jgi:DNA primase
LIEHAAVGADLATPEGRARLLAQVRPLWQQIGASEIKRQLLAEIARAAQSSLDELERHWAERGEHGGRAGERGGGPPPRPPRLPLVVTRRPPAAAADLALRLLLAHSAWWEQLANDDQALLHGLPGAHGRAVAWLETQVTEHGMLTWGQLDEHLRGHELYDTVRAWMEASLLREMPHDFDDLQRVLHKLWIAQLNEQSRELAGIAADDPGALQQLKDLHKRVQQHQALAQAARA